MTDKDLILAWGGPAKVAELLGYDKKRGGVQRVQNWLSRGIPSKVWLEFGDVLRMPPKGRKFGRRSTDKSS